MDAEFHVYQEVCKTSVSHCISLHIISLKSRELGLEGQGIGGNQVQFARDKIEGGMHNIYIIAYNKELELNLGRDQMAKKWHSKIEKMLKYAV